MTARLPDINGWFEVKDNPISKVGVFPYLGSSIDPEGKLGLDPERIYSVYRSEQELSKPETIESFKLLPWIDEHTMLGDSETGLVPPEEKGIEGVIGEDVYFENGYLKANIKLFSEEQSQKLNQGKNELSCGYRCKYEPQSGIFGDEEYQLIQINIRGNHLASVPEGRMGPEVAVLDHKQFTFTVDGKELRAMADEEKDTGESGKDEMTLSQLTEVVNSVIPQITEVMEIVKALQSAGSGGEGGEMDEGGEDNLAEGYDENEEKEEGSAEDSNAAAMDAMDKRLGTVTSDFENFKKDGVKAMLKEVGQRDELAARVSEFTGTFDHAEMTVNEVAVYACDKLELKDIPTGHEVTAVNSYLSNRPKVSGFALDAQIKQGGTAAKSAVDKHFSAA